MNWIDVAIICALALAWGRLSAWQYRKGCRAAEAELKKNLMAYFNKSDIYVDAFVPLQEGKGRAQGSIEIRIGARRERTDKTPATASAGAKE